ncbi:hypothetical protein TWF694_001365 [Orbilia ellipsospora]|uniref:CHAT domain-containing protein n=1 Tax=Orbilia ellipsospora TaxID=2528407 RepID=A0AAV9XTY2_9PEZI
MSDVQQAKIFRQIRGIKEAEKIKELDYQLKRTEYAKRILDLRRELERTKAAAKIKNLRNARKNSKGKERLKIPEWHTEKMTEINQIKRPNLPEILDPVQFEDMGISYPAEISCQKPQQLVDDGWMDVDSGRLETGHEETAQGPEPNQPTEIGTVEPPAELSDDIVELPRTNQAEMLPLSYSTTTFGHLPIPDYNGLQFSATIDDVFKSDALAIKYYEDLYIPDDGIERQFLDMDLLGLYEFVDDVTDAITDAAESDARAFAGQTKLLSILYYLIFSKTRAVKDIQKAIEKSEEALGHTSIDSPSYEVGLRNLIVILLRKFEHTKSPEDLTRAILRAEEMMTITPHTNSDFTFRLHDLFAMKSRKALLVGSAEELYEASFMGEAILSSMGPIEAPKFDKYTKRFEETGSFDDFQMAIKEVEKVMEENHCIGRVNLCNKLADCLMVRFEKSGDVDDMTKAIESLEKLVAAVGGTSNEIGRELTKKLIALLTTASARTENSGLLQDASDKLEELFEATPRDHPERLKLHFYYIFDLFSKLYRAKNVKDLDIVIERCESILVSATPGSTEESLELLTLALSLGLRFWRTRNQDNLEQAIKHYRQVQESDALKPSNKDFTELKSVMAPVSRNLELFKMFQANNIGGPDTTLADIKERYLPHYIQTLDDSFVEAAESTSSPPTSERSKAGRDAVAMAARQMLSDASRSMDFMVDRLPLLAPRQLSQQDQQHNLAQVTEFAVLAASVGLEVGKDAYHAVRLLELGRGVIAGLHFGARSDLANLREQHAGLAAKFERLWNILYSSSSKVTTFESTSTYIQISNERHDANDQLDETIDQIRRLKGFENFLLPPSADELMAAASAGPIIIMINASDRSDALIIERTAIRSIGLPALKSSDIGENVKLIRSIRSTSTFSAIDSSRVSRMLEWLWDAAVQPILDNLGFTKTPSKDEEWPRVWWILTGQLSLLPLHAAGYHSPDSNNSALERVISSYSPSVKALLYARQNSRANNSSATSKALLVSMDTTPKNSDLRFAREEVRMLEGILPISKEILERPCRKAILDRLSECEIFHFAGHGESNPVDPSKSALLVSDWEDNPLTVEHLIGLDFRAAPPLLAYLAACSTSDVGTEGLENETLHLVSACQLAGFRHVVGSLWEVPDRESVDMATEMYGTIIENGMIDGSKIALGVHKATRKLRGVAARDAVSRKFEEKTTVSSLSEGVLDVGDEESEIRGTRRLRPQGWKDKDKTEGNPFIWAAYIHVGP